MTVTLQSLHPADRLGAIRAQISDLRTLEARAVEEVNALIDKVDPADPRIEGQLFEVLHVVQIRETLIAEKVRTFLHPNQLRAATRVTEVHSLKVTARKTALKVAA